MSTDSAGEAYPDDWWEQIEEPPEDEDGYVHTAVTAAEREEIRPLDFWKARPTLAHLHDFARARRAGPWAVLGVTLARVIAATPPQAQLPPTIGSWASLNLFVGLVGKSGGGKDVARRVAADALDLGNETFMTAPLGSGEGLSHMFMRPPKKGEGDEPVQYKTAALVTIGEIDTLDALVKRQSSTISSQLRQAAMGEQLGFFYVDPTKRMLVPEHAYRMSLVAGIQPARSEVLLGEAEGGTPQRFIWLPAGDPDAPDVQPIEPPAITWKPPDWGRAPRAAGRAVHWEIRLPEVARETIIAARLANLRNQVEALDSHALLTRAKVAAALAILDGRAGVDEEDWDLSGVVMAVSDTQRALCQRALDSEKGAKNRAQAVAEAERTVIVNERVDEAKVQRVCQSVKRLLGQHGQLTSSKLRGKLGANASHLEAAAEALVLSGDIVVEDTEYRGQKGKTYRLR